MRDRAEERVRRVRDRVAERDLDGLLVTQLANVRYLTGFTGSAGLLVVLHHETIFLTDFRYEIQVGSEIPSEIRTEVVRADTWDRLKSVLKENSSARRLGFESGSTTVVECSKLTEIFAAVDWVPVEDLVEDLRASKCPEEVESIRRAAQLCSEALEATLPTVGVGRREIDIAAYLERELRVRGSEWHPFQTIVASGPRAALPHARTSERAIAAGDLLLLDFGAQLDGYCADLTRTYVVGARATEKQKIVYDLVRTAQLNALAGIRAGMSGRDADSLARKVIESQGYGELFGHSLGHGLGLEVHEAPRLSKANDSPLPENAVVTIEPGIYQAGWGGVRIEDDIVLRSEGCELLSDGNNEMVEIM